MLVGTSFACSCNNRLLDRDHLDMSATYTSHFRSSPVHTHARCSHVKFATSLTPRLRRPRSRLAVVSNFATKVAVACTAAVKPSAHETDVSTPHSGYHYNGAKRRFFEGWYFKVRSTDKSEAVAGQNKCSLQEHILVLPAQHGCLA